MKPSHPHKFMIRLRPVLRFVKFRILHVDDSPERIARGLAVGLFVGYTPLMGIHMLLAWAGAALLRANKAIAILCVWISNPLTLIPIYYPCYLLGHWLFGLRSHRQQVDPEQMEKLLASTLSFYRMLMEFHTAAFWKDVSSVLMQVGLETFVGSLIIGALVASAGYWLGYHGVNRYRHRKHRKKQKRHHPIAS